MRVSKSYVQRAEQRSDSTKDLILTYGGIIEDSARQSQLLSSTTRTCTGCSRTRGAVGWVDGVWGLLLHSATVDLTLCYIKMPGFFLSFWHH